MKVREVLLMTLFLPMLAAAAPPGSRGPEGSTENAGLHRYNGCEDMVLGPGFGIVIGVGAVARRRRRPA